MKHTILWLVCFVLLQDSQGQSPVNYGTINTGGVVTGGSGDEWMWQSIHGIRYRNFFAGVGAGMDNYFRKTVPLFADFRVRLLDKKHAPFLYMDGGVSLAAKRSERMENWGWTVETRFRSGYYYDVGAGYEWSLTRKFGLLLSAGYSQKSLREVQDYQYVGGPVIFNPWMHDEDRYRYVLRRFSLKAGFRF